MKKWLKNTFLLTLTMLSFALVFSTVAWFKDGTNITMGENGDINVVGGIEADYYGGGTGTQTDPFIISNRNHLYNLAWLQYLGKYNTVDYTATTPTKSIQEMYFKISDNINMEGIVLPPIGTETYPFFGHIDGGIYTTNSTTGQKELTGTYVISNLVTSNDDPTKTSSDFGVNKPSKIYTHALTLNGDSQLTRVVGFFGVVGNIPTNEAITSTDYASITPSMENIVLNNVKVKTGANSPDQLLIGLAAGYVSESGSLSGVMVKGNSELVVNGETVVDSTITTKLSDYGLVGYTPASNTGNQSIGYNQKITQYYHEEFAPVGDDAKWGGSVNMSEVFNRVKGYRPTGTSSYNFEVTDKYVNDSFDSSSSSTPRAVRTNSYNTNNDYRGNYVFSNNSSSKLYLYGGTHLTNSYYYTFKGVRITDGTNYMTSSLGNQTSATLDNTTSLWKFDSVTENGNQYRIYNYNSDTELYTYLRNDNGTLRTSSNVSQSTAQSTSSIWTVAQASGDSTKISIDQVTSTKTYRLLFTDGSWKLVDVDTSVTHSKDYSITNSNSTRYLPSNFVTNTSNTALTGSTSEVYVFTLDSDNRITFTYNNQTYYLCCYRTNNSSTYYLCGRQTASDGATNNTGQNYYLYLRYFANNGNPYVRTNQQRSSYYYYLTYNNGWLINRTTTNNSTTNAPKFTKKDNWVEYPYINSYLNNTLSTFVESPEWHGEDVDMGMQFTSTNTTYIPLNVDTSGQPTAKNTGYITAAATGNFDYSGHNGTDGWTYLRSITMAQYGLSYIDNSFNSTSKLFTSMKTIKDGDVVDIDLEKDFVTNKRFKPSKTILEGILGGGTNVSGLHFLNTGFMGDISTNNIVEAKNIRLRDPDPTNTSGYKNYSTYQLPVYSIDFNLEEKGFITFFAGVYNGQSADDNDLDSFFSLHKITRNSSNQITAIKELKCIYSTSSDPTVPYTYSYKGWSCSSCNKIWTNSEIEVVRVQSTSPRIQYTRGHWCPTCGRTVTSLELQENMTSAFSRPDGATVLFDTDWIGVNDDVTNYFGHVFYFEIPVDAGEFCLGNVRDGVEGAYLIYLDIGSNGSDVKDQVYSYSITTANYIAYYPIGVDFGVSGATGNGGDSVCISIDSGEDGDASFAVNDTGTVITVDLDDIADYTYKSGNFGTTFTISGNSPGDIAVTPTIEKVRYIYVKTKLAQYNIILIYDDEGALTSCTLNGETANLSTITSTTIQTLGAYDVLDLIAEAEETIVVTLTRTAGTNPINAQLPAMPWTEGTDGSVTYAITSSATGITIKFTINDVTVTFGGNSVSNNGSVTIP